MYPLAARLRAVSVIGAADSSTARPSIHSRDVEVSSTPFRMTSANQGCSSSSTGFGVSTRAPWLLKVLLDIGTPAMLEITNVVMRMFFIESTVKLASMKSGSLPATKRSASSQRA